MNKDKQRIAIAEACGWNSFGMFNGNPNQPAAFPPGVNTTPKSLPDYLNDLNAMHEAEKTLKGDQRIEYISKLFDVCGIGVAPMFSTAPQRAEAFLRTLGKWREE